MKKFLTIFLAIILAVAALALLGCEGEESRIGEYTVFGLTNRCPVKVDIKVDGDGKVAELIIDEYLSVYDMGRLDFDGKNYSRYGVKVSDALDGYAKFVRVGGQIYAYDGEKYVCDELVGEDKSFEAFILGGGGEQYVMSVSEGDFDIVNSEGKNLSVPFNEYDDYKLDKNRWADKMENGFHEGNEYPHGWKEDIYSLITHVKNHGISGYTGDEKPSGKEGTYRVGKYDTLVTLSNFHDYMKLIKSAYLGAKEKVNKA